MITLLLSVVLFASAPASPRPPSSSAAVRCGWLDNPTPGNFSLRDRDGEWVLAEQGGYQARGVDLIPDLSGDEFVETNGHHGYACACVKASVDEKTHQVLKVVSVKQRLLKVCLADPDLPPMPR